MVQMATFRCRTDVRPGPQPQRCSHLNRRRARFVERQRALDVLPRRRLTAARLVTVAEARLAGSITGLVRGPTERSTSR